MEQCFLIIAQYRVYGLVRSAGLRSQSLNSLTEMNALC